MLVGSLSLIREARRVRKLFGGAMRQAGIIAAGALYAVQNHRDRLVIDHEYAKQLGQKIQTHSHLSVRGDRIDTNMVIFEIEPGLASASRFEIELQQLGVDCFAVGSQAVRLVTHLDISGDQIAQACTAIDRAVENCAIN